MKVASIDTVVTVGAFLTIGYGCDCDVVRRRPSSHVERHNTNAVLCSREEPGNIDLCCTHSKLHNVTELCTLCDDSSLNDVAVQWLRHETTGDNSGRSPYDTNRRGVCSSGDVQLRRRVGVICMYNVT